jgi:antitoxin (DNA-binding transcriptional repressor) of toxin-antitoxin stability system
MPAAAAARGCDQREDVKQRRDGTNLGHGEDMEAAREEEDDLDGFWVSYGRRCPRRRLPPLIPSLVARGALRRTRTDDGRLVIRIVPIVHEDDSSVVPPLRELPAAARDASVRRTNVARPDDDRTNLGHGEDVEAVKQEEKDEEDDSMKAKQAQEEDDLLDGFWVSYGRRCPRRRLPPLISSLVARGALRRTRTDDGRLVIRIVPVVWPERVRARRRRDRLVELEHEDDSPVVPPPLRELLPAPAREAGFRINVARVYDDAATPSAGECVRDVEDAVEPLQRVPSVRCFADVFKLDSIGGSSLQQMLSLRTVH